MPGTKDNNLAPICLFVYNRPMHVRKTLRSLQANRLANLSILYIFSDGPKANDMEDAEKVKTVREIIKQEKWCQEVVIFKSPDNQGLADSIINGVTKVINEYGKIIVIEDDLVLSPGFLIFMNEALEIYKSEDKVMHVSGYMFPLEKKLPDTFFVNIATCWGWGTWQRAWQYFNKNATDLLEKINESDQKIKFNLDGNYDWYRHLLANARGNMKTWAIRWYASFFLLNGFCLHPGYSLIRNIGTDASGQNCGREQIYLNQAIADQVTVTEIPIEEAKHIRKAIGKFFRGHQASLTNKIFTRLKKLCRPSVG